MTTYDLVVKDLKAMTKMYMIADKQESKLIEKGLSYDEIDEIEMKKTSARQLAELMGLIFATEKRQEEGAQVVDSLCDNLGVQYGALSALDRLEIFSFVSEILQVPSYFSSDILPTDGLCELVILCTGSHADDTMKIKYLKDFTLSFGEQTIKMLDKKYTENYGDISWPVSAARVGESIGLTNAKKVAEELAKTVEPGTLTPEVIAQVCFAPLIDAEVEKFKVFEDGKIRFRALRRQALFSEAD